MTTLIFLGWGGLHPLKGPNLDEFGPRFLPLSDAYDLELRKLLLRKYEDLGIERPLHEGTYCYVSGPTFETRAESRLLRLVGGDAVGMSTVPEVIAARHCGWRVLALSLITNACVTEPPASFHDANPVAMDEGIASHQEVLENGRKASLDVGRQLLRLLLVNFKWRGIGSTSFITLLFFLFPFNIRAKPAEHSLILPIYTYLSVYIYIYVYTREKVANH